MPAATDPQIGESASRNSKFADSFTRGRIIAESLGDATAVQTVVDVGAFTGETSAWFATLFPGATIWAIEPFMGSFTELASGAGPRIRCWHFAAADFDGSATLYENAIAHTNSLLPINPDSQDSIDISRRRVDGVNPDYTAQSSTVTAKRLDTFAAEVGVTTIDLLKVDVQGAEVDVLRGAQGLLPRTRAILIEVSLYDYYTSSSSIGQIEGLIRPHGFALWSITDISHNPMNGRTDWVELLFKNDRVGT
jgi:FkbM family methyltransferase